MTETPGLWKCLWPQHLAFRYSKYFPDRQPETTPVYRTNQSDECRYIP